MFSAYKSIKDAKQNTCSSPKNEILLPEEEKGSEMNYKNIKMKKSSLIQTGFSSFNNKMMIKVKSDTKSIDVLMKKACNLRRSNDNFNIILKVIPKG